MLKVCFPQISHESRQVIECVCVTNAVGSWLSGINLPRKTVDVRRPEAFVKVKLSRNYLICVSKGTINSAFRLQRPPETVVSGVEEPHTSRCIRVTRQLQSQQIDRKHRTIVSSTSITLQRAGDRVWLRICDDVNLAAFVVLTLTVYLIFFTAHGYAKCDDLSVTPVAVLGGGW